MASDKSVIQQQPLASAPLDPYKTPKYGEEFDQLPWLPSDQYQLNYITDFLLYKWGDANYLITNDQHQVLLLVTTFRNVSNEMVYRFEDSATNIVVQMNGLVPGNCTITHAFGNELAVPKRVLQLGNLVTVSKEGNIVISLKALSNMYFITRDSSESKIGDVTKKMWSDDQANRKPEKCPGLEYFHITFDNHKSMDDAIKVATFAAILSTEPLIGTPTNWTNQPRYQMPVDATPMAAPYVAANNNTICFCCWTTPSIDRYGGTGGCGDCGDCCDCDCDGCDCDCDGCDCDGSGAADVGSAVADTSCDCNCC